MSVQSLPDNEFAIGVLSAESGCKVPTIRYYEKIGLLPEPLRTGGNQRRYRQSHLKCLRFICHARELGFNLDAIRELLSLSSPSSCQRADQIVYQHLLDIEQKIERLLGLKAELSAMLHACETSQTYRCRVIEILSDHS